MNRTKKLGIVFASVALASGAAIGAPAAIAAVNGDAKATVSPSSGVQGIKEGEPVEVQPGTGGFATVSCNKKAISGGGRTSGYNIYLTDSYPLDNKTWAVNGFNNGDTVQTIRAVASCKGAN